MAETLDSQRRRSGWLSRGWRAFTAPSARILDDIDRRRVRLFQEMVVVVFPLIFMVGLVVMPMVSRASPPWRGPTFLPASIALAVSVVSLAMSRLGRFKEAMGLYACMFVASPALAVMQDANPANIPIGTLMIGGPILATALFEDFRVPAAFVLMVVVASLLVPVANPHLAFGDAAALVAANLTNGILVVIFSVFRTGQERERRGALERAYRELRDHRDLFTSLSGNVPGALFRASASPDRTLVYLSENFTTVTGHPRERFLGPRALPLAEVVAEEDRPRREESIAQAVAAGARYEVAYRIRKAGDGAAGLRWIHETGCVVRDAEGRAWIDAIALDVTEGRARDDQLRQAQKMESVGMLAGGLAHDFNNILTVIVSATSLARFTLRDEGALHAAEAGETLDLVEEAANRAKGIVDQLLSLSRPQKPTLLPVDLTVAAKHVQRLLAVSLDKSIRLSTDLPPGSALVLADPVQLEQVALNLCVNAAHAMTHMRAPGEPWGGTLGMTLRRVIPDAAFLAAHPEAEDHVYWVLSIQDTGVGISRENRPRLFTPFFTTKMVGQGTGLGLSMVYSMVKAHGGFVTVYSEPGAGSTFNLFLPATTGERNGLALDSAGSSFARGRGSILVVDDEEGVRRLASRILEECGYTVFTAANGEEGVSLYRALEGKIDLVLLDLMMPVMSGRETFYRLREIRPEVRVLLSSGFRHDLRVKELLDAGVVAFLDKPYTLESLSGAVRSALRVPEEA